MRDRYEMIRDSVQKFMERPVLSVFQALLIYLIWAVVLFLVFV